MIRAWLSRRKRAAEPSVDTAVFLGAQFDLKDAQNEGLRDTIAELRAQAVELRAENARLQVSVATALAMQWLQRGAADTRRLAEEDTAVVSADQFRRTRPRIDAPTEKYRRPR